MLVWQRFTVNKDTVVTKMILPATMTMQVCVEAVKDSIGVGEGGGYSVMFVIVIFVVIFLFLSFPEEEDDTSCPWWGSLFQKGVWIQQEGLAERRFFPQRKQRSPHETWIFLSIQVEERDGREGERTEGEGG